MVRTGKKNPGSAYYCGMVSDGNNYWFCLVSSRDLGSDEWKHGFDSKSEKISTGWFFMSSENFIRPRNLTSNSAACFSDNIWILSLQIGYLLNL